jgi:hypothetical protein
MADDPTKPSSPILKSEAEAAPKSPAGAPLLSFDKWRMKLPKNNISGLPWMIAIGVPAITSVVAFSWLGGLPPTPNCQKFLGATLATAQKLYCADQAARKRDEASLTEALKLAATIDAGSPLYAQSEKLTNDWARSMLLLATQKVEGGDLKKGVKLAQLIPKTTKVYPEVQTTIQDWEKNWQKGKDAYQKAREALSNQDLSMAMEHVRALSQFNSPYWDRQANRVISEISIEQEAFQQINAAKDQASYGTPDDIAAAMKLVSKVDPKRLAKKKAGDMIEEWSTKLVEIAKQAQASGDYKTMIAAAEKVPPTTKVADQAQAYFQMGLASKLGSDGQLWSHIQAYTLTQQIPAAAPLQEVAQKEREKWEGQIQNWGQLSLAQWFANFDQQASYDLAIEQAAMVSQNQPRRVEAQTFIAQWKKLDETFPTRQFIARAKQFAVGESIAGLQLAILEASKILNGQALWNEAQGLISGWNGAIQRVQDQPILDQARALAKQGNLDQAIQTAGTIASGRSLYGEAQTAIGDWTAQIQIAQDRPILNEAEGLASSGQLSAAVVRASDIRPGRALYGEAQSRISEWNAQLRPAPPPPEEAPEPSNNFSGEEAPPPSVEESPLDEGAPPPVYDAPPPPEPAPPLPAEPPAAEEPPPPAEPPPAPAPPSQDEGF